MIHTDGTPTIAHRPPITDETRYALTERGHTTAAFRPRLMPAWLVSEVRGALAEPDVDPTLRALAAWCGIVAE